MSRANYRNKPKTNMEEGKSGWIKTLAKVVGAGSKSGGSSGGSDSDSGNSDAAAIKSIGESGASIVKTYKDKQSSGSSSGGKGGA